ncbi:Peroxisome biogenesis protein 22 [Coccomyxa sp. Obi]|nr:Peroxisome biogenesis protein 22 [Coccomyxa sp. Obi]
MSQLLQDLKTWFNSLLARIAGLLSGASPGTLQLTGVLGLAALLYGFYALRGAPKTDSDEQRSEQLSRASGSTATASSSLEKPQTNTAPSPATTSSAQLRGEERSLAWAVRSQLSGIRNVTVSAPGVLLEEWTPSDLQESAVLREDAAAVVREMLKTANVYVMAHVIDDIGEATVRGALEAGALVGLGAGQIPPHRVLFCSTLDGKVSIVRQLEPDLHIDGHPQTIEALKRFMPQLLHVRHPNAAAAGVGSPNVGSAGSLLEVFKSS